MLLFKGLQNITGSVKQSFHISTWEYLTCQVTVLAVINADERRLALFKWERINPFMGEQNATKLIKHGQVRTYCNLSLFSPSCWRDIWKSSSMKLNIEDTPYWISSILWESQEDQSTEKAKELTVTVSSSLWKWPHWLHWLKTDSGFIRNAHYTLQYTFCIWRFPVLPNYVRIALLFSVLGACFTTDN